MHSVVVVLTMAGAVGIRLTLPWMTNLWKFPLSKPWPPINSILLLKRYVHSCYVHHPVSAFSVSVHQSVDAQWLERSWTQVPAGTTGEFSSPGSTFSADSFWFPFHPCVTAASLKRPQSFCQKCRWQVTAKRTCTLCMWLGLKWHGKVVHGCMVSTECAQRWQQFLLAPAM